MKYITRAVITVAVISALALAWLWWEQPQKVDMRSYVPADALVYVEANSLEAVTNGITSTDAWKTLAPAAGLKTNAGQFGRLARLAAWTGIGPAETVVLGRAQVAVAVSGFAKGSEEEEALNIRPLFAVIIETHSSNSRARSVVTKRVGELARKIYGADQPLTKQSDGVELMVWNAQGGGKQIVAAVESGAAFVGNDERTVRACVAARRGERPSLASNADVDEVRNRVGGNDGLVFGYMSPAGASQVFGLLLAVQAAQALTDARAQSGAVTLLPQLVSSTLGSAGWSGRVTGGRAEDRYFFGLRDEIAAQLRAPLATDPSLRLGAADFVPSSTYSLSRYNCSDPASAVAGMKLAISSHADVLTGAIASKLLDASIQSYGVDDPQQFLRAIGPEIATARLDNSGEGTVTIVEVRDEAALREFVKKRVGPNPKSEHIGDAELMINSSDEERGSAAFASGRLMLGPEENMRKCLEAREQRKTLSLSEQFTTPAQSGEPSANALTFTRDTEPASALILTLASQSGLRERPADEAQLNRALESLGYSVSATRLAEGGFEKVTRSSFGLLGTIVTQFAASSSR